MATREIRPPVRGVTDGAPFIRQPGDATAPGHLLNLVPEDAGSGRTRLATRAKASSVFSGARFSGPVGGIHSIPRASGVAGTELGPETLGTQGGTVAADTFKGQCVVLETDWSTRLVLSDNRGTGSIVSPPPVGAGGHDGNQVAWIDDDAGVFTTIGRNLTLTTQDVSVVGVNRFSLAAGGITHQTWCVDADPGYSSPLPGAPPQINLYANHVVAHAGYVFVMVDRYVYCFRADNLTYVKRHAIDWAQEVQCAGKVTLGGKSYLVLADTGSATVGGAVVNDPGPSPTYPFGMTGRACLALHEILTAADGTPVAVGASVLARRPMPMGLISSSPRYEDHRTFRFSEYSAQRPRGCDVFSIAVAQPDTSTVYVYAATTNQGFGVDGTQADQRPDGTAPYLNARKINLSRALEGDALSGLVPFVDPAAPVRYGAASDVGGWERDTGSVGSLRRSFSWHGTTLQNDLTPSGTSPHAVGQEPTLFAVAADESRGMVYFAGRIPSLVGPLPNVYGCRASDGAMLWETYVRGTVQQNALAVDPTTGNVVVGMIRSTDWTTEDGSPSVEKAELLELAKDTGEVVRSFDLTDGINFNGYITSVFSWLGVYGVAVSASGRVAMTLTPHRSDV